MIWAILALLGVPLWVIAGGIAYMLLLNRHLRRREGDIAARTRSTPGKRWRRGHGLWVGDVFAWRSSPSSWSESLDVVRSATVRQLSMEEAHQLARLKDPVLAVFAADGRTFEVAVPSSARAALLGSFGGDGAATE
jgi:hypothetical protein